MRNRQFLNLPIVKIFLFILLCSFNPVFLTQSYQSSSNIVEYNYHESFQTSDTQDIAFNYSLKPIYNTLFINSTPLAPSYLNPFVFLFVQNNTEVPLERVTYYTENSTGNYFILNFIPDASNTNIRITAIKGTHLNVTLSLLGLDLPNIKDVSDNQTSPTVVHVSSNQVFYGVLTGSDLKDYYRFTFDKTINVRVNVTIITPRTDSLTISEEFTPHNDLYAFSGTYPASHPVIANQLTDFASIGLSVPSYYTPISNSTNLKFIYIINITSNDFQNSSTSTSSTSTSSLGGFQIVFLSGFILLVIIRSTKRKQQ